MLGLLGALLFFPPDPAVRIVPVKTPTAKKAKYMMAAGCFNFWVSRGGKEKETVSLLCMPIRTRSSKIMITKTVLKRSLAFIRQVRGRYNSFQKVKGKKGL